MHMGGATAECHYEIELNFRTTSSRGGGADMARCKVDKEGCTMYVVQLQPQKKLYKIFMNTWEQLWLGLKR